MKRFVLFMAVFVAADMISQSASATARTVREDRVWEYSAPGTYYDSNSGYLHLLKFDGNTVEANGKTYSRLALINTKAYRGKNFHGYKFEYFLYADEDRDDTMYYMREEDGRVYTLVQKEKWSEDRETFSILKTDPGELPEDAVTDEMLVYDWNKEDGETMSYPMLTEYEWDADPDVYRFEGTIRYRNPVMIQGEECKVMQLEHDGYVWPDITFIEGLGPTFNGTLGALNFDMITGVPDNSRYPVLQCSLNRVFDPDGNVIYEDEYPMRPTNNSYGYMPTVREDRTWEYRSYGGRPNNDFSRFRTIYHFIKFDSDPVVFNHHEYKMARICKMIETEYGNDIPEHIISEETWDTPLYAMREERDRVYVLKDTKGNNVTEITDATDTSGFHDEVLYDWTLKDGDLWTYVDFSEEYPEDCPTVEYGEPMKIGEDECRVMNLSDFDHISLIEGIGATVNGSLGDYTFLLTSHMEPWINTDAPGMDSTLERVYDGDGNLIYGEALVLQDSVEGVTPDSDGEDSLVFDVLGRRVSSTAPGSVYIRGGKKFVAK